MTFVSSLKSRINTEVESFKSDLRSRGMSEDEINQRYGVFTGYQPVEIEAIKTAQHVTFLPLTYLQFLEAMGHQQGGVLFKGADSSVGALKVLKNMFRLSVSDTLSESLDFSDLFIFLSYQSSDYFLFYINPPHDDPPVFYFAERLPEPVKVADKLSEWFLEQAFDPIEFAMKTLPGYTANKNLPF